MTALLGGALTVALLVLRLLGVDGGAPGPASTSQAPGTTTGEIFLEPKDSTGPDPFTASVATAPTKSAEPSPPSAPPPTATASPVPAPTAGGTQPPIQATVGGTVGLYGGTLDNTACDKEQMVGFLEANPEKARAWATVQGIDPSAISTYISALTPVTLQRDTRVTNHGFGNGVAYPRQSVMQAGTAVLVDEFGVPRARCYCGNPLREPKPVAVQPRYTGQPWPGFSPDNLSVIRPAAQPLAAIPVVDRATGAVFQLPTGGDGSQPSPTPGTAIPFTCNGSTQVPALGGQATETYATLVMADGPLGYWRLDDAEGSSAVAAAGGDASVVGNPRLAQPGIVPGSRAILLDGVDDWIDIPDVTFDDDFTLEAWVFLCGDSVGNADAPFGQVGTGPDINFYQETLRLFDGTGDPAIATTTVAWPGWRHVAATRIDGSIALYIDGTLVGEGIHEAPFPVQAVGRGNAGFLQGGMDEVAVYNHGLSASFVAEHAAAGR